MTSFVRLSRNQRRAIAALLQHRTITAAAAAIGLNEKTVRRYLENLDFQQALTQAESDTIDEAGRRLLSGQDQALDALEDLILGAEKESDRRLAAKDWLSFTLAFRELKNDETRLAVLEEVVYYQYKKAN
jgi:hypothetical protein